jgi:DNA repair exonuclease SbcCD nuclease subunit
MCPRASIISKWGVKYPARLENCIESVNWVERTAERFSCDYILNLGDFFDKPDLSSETITACNDIQWSEIMHYSIVGNHDASTSSLIFNSVNRLLRDRHSVIVEPQILPLSDCTICFLPYVVECDRKPLSEYFKNVDSTKPRIIVSHNDINGIQLGPVVSKTGFTIEEIEANCDLFINGHLHNGQAITDKIINLGNLTGKDFGENAIKHAHNIAILDTSTLELEYIENPYAFNFYKLQIDTAADLDLLNNLKSRAVVSIKCDSALLEIVKQKVSEKHNILESRIILTRNYTSDDSSEAQDLELSVDHITRFIECCKNHIEETPMLLEEISEICK